jgi:outer membrane protein TolC
MVFKSVAQDSVLTLSLAQALQMGIDSSKSLKISNSRMQLAEAKYNQAVDATIPSVRFNAGYTRLSDIEEPKFLFPGATEPIALFPVYVNNYSAALSVSETIFSGFRLKYAKESQKLLRDAAKFENSNDKNEISFAIINAFFNLYKLRVSAAVIDSNLALIKERLRETDVALKNGMATKNDVLRWQMQQSNLELTRIDVNNNIEIANYNLNLMLGLNGNMRIEPDTNSVNAVTAQKTFSDYLAAAESNRNDVAAAELRSRASYNALRVAQNSYLPRIAVNGELLDARPNVRYIPPIDEFRTTWSAGISLQWDLVSLYSNRHNVDEARALYRQSMENYSVLTDEMKSEINRNYRMYTEAIQKEVVMKKNLEQATENYRLTDSRFRNSLVILSDLLDADNQMLSAQINLAITRADIQIAYYRLLKSTGRIN